MFLGWRHCVCGTLDRKEGATNDKEADATLMNIHERCVPREENEEFHAEVLECPSNATSEDLVPDVCKLGSCATDGYCFKWLVKEGDTITTTFG